MLKSTIIQNKPEIWRDIIGFEGLYQISNCGRIRSVDRISIQKSSHGTFMKKQYKGKLLTPYDNGNGYKIVHLSKPNNKRKSCYIHRLVAQAFIPNPNKYHEINHIDYDKNNNNASNLEWISRQDNILHSVDHMRKPRKKAKPTSTGEKYITQKNGKWRLNIQRQSLKCDKIFNSLEEAVLAKEMIMGA